MKKEITKNEYWILTGLLHVAQKAMKQVEFCEMAAIDLLDIPQTNGLDSSHFGDAVWDEGSINTVLRKMKIKVKK